MLCSHSFYKLLYYIIITLLKEKFFSERNLIVYWISIDIIIKMKILVNYNNFKKMKLKNYLNRNTKVVYNLIGSMKYSNLLEDIQLVILSNNIKIFNKLIE